jgi:uncharacterized protein (TIGR00369 family)
MNPNIKSNLTPEQWQSAGAKALPGHLGVQVHEVMPGAAHLSLQIQPHHHAPNGYLHAGTVLTLADTACGYGCVASLPAGAIGFTTLETKSNHLGTALSGQIEARASVVHQGRSTQVWDATVTQGDKTLAIFRCTQMILWPKAASS